MENICPICGSINIENDICMCCGFDFSDISWEFFEDPDDIIF